MAKYLNKEMFLQSMGLLGDETKYGNRDGEHQSRSYSTWMGYEIMGCVEDSVVEEDVAAVVRCKDCKYWKDIDLKTTEHEKICEIGFYKIGENGFCSFGERKDNE